MTRRDDQDAGSVVDSPSAEAIATDPDEAAVAAVAVSSLDGACPGSRPAAIAESAVAAVAPCCSNGVVVRHIQGDRRERGVARVGETASLAIPAITAVASRSRLAELARATRAGGVDAAVSAKPALSTPADSADSAQASLGEVSCETGDRLVRRVLGAGEGGRRPGGVEKTAAGPLPSQSTESAARAEPTNPSV